MGKESLQTAIDKTKMIVAEYESAIRDAISKRDATQNVLWLLESINDKEKASE